MPEARRALGEIGRFWKALSLRERIILGFLAAAVVAFVAAIVLWAGRPEYTILVSGASDDEVKEVVRILDGKGEEYRLEDGGRVLVRAERKPLLAAELAQHGAVPGEKILGFADILERDTFYTTRDRRRLMMRIALQNELSLMIANLRGIERASVLIKDGRGADIFGEGKPAGASISIVPVAGGRLSNQLVKAVSGLVTSAVPDIDPADITVVDARSGRVHQAEEDGGSAEERGFFALKEDVEKALAEKARSLFVRMGMDAVVVVNAKLNLASVNERIQQLDPRQQGPFMLVDRRSKSTSYAAAGTSGPVGAEANRLPGTVVGVGAGLGGNAPVARERPSTQTDNDNVITYSYVLKDIVHSPEGVVDVTASVVVFDRIVEDNGEVTHWRPAQQDLEDYRGLVANALGTGIEQVKLTHVPSAFPPPDVVKAGVAVSVGAWGDVVADILLALLAVAGLVGGYFVLRGFLERPDEKAEEVLPEVGADRISLLQKAIRQQAETQADRVARILSRWIVSG